MNPPGAQPQSADRRALLLIALLALVVSAPTLANGFAYDDEWIIVTNARVHDLSRWQEWFTTSYWPTHQATLYRPLTTAAFAVQWAVGDGAPFVFHAVNVVLAVAGAVAFAWLASMVLPPAGALIAGALFAVHPVHVEAVANVVGQAELSTGLAMFAAMAIYLRARIHDRWQRSTTLGLTAIFLAAVFMKEHAILLPAWFLVAEGTVLRRAEPARGRLATVGPLYVLLAAIGLLALAARWNVLDAVGGDIAHPALMDLTAVQRLFVMLDVLPHLVRLLVWPAQLYADYSPELISINPGPSISQLNGVMIAVGFAALGVVTLRRSPRVAFGLLMAFVAWLPTSNLLLASGVLIAERALYVPGAGAVIAVGAGFAWLDRRFAAGNLRWRGLRAAGGVLTAGVLVLAIARFVDRQRTWRSSDTVFHTLVQDAPQSFKAHHAWGGVLFERGDARGGEREWLMAIRIFPQYHKLYEDLGGQYRQLGFCHAALPMYARALELGGPLPLSRAGTVACELQLARFRDARRTAALGVFDGHDPAWFRARLRSADSALAALDSLP